MILAKAPSSAEKPYVGTQAAQRAIAILQIFTDAKPEWSLNDISGKLKLNRTTTYRLVSVLISSGLVEQLAGSDQYRLGSEVIALGGRAIRANPLRHLCQQELKTLAENTGETCTLEILSGAEILIVEEYSGRFLINASPELGTRWPAFATSSGLAILAYLPDQQVDDILNENLPKITKKTTTNPAELRKLIRRSKKNGYLVLADALEPGYTAVSSAILNHEGQAVAAVSVGGPNDRLRNQTVESIGARVVVSTRALSNKLGYRDQCL